MLARTISRRRLPPPHPHAISTLAQAGVNAALAKAGVAAFATPTYPSQSEPMRFPKLLQLRWSSRTRVPPDAP
jgi:hypothetical protein